jgi:hypothetical protein
VCTLLSGDQHPKGLLNARKDMIQRLRGELPRNSQDSSRSGFGKKDLCAQTDGSSSDNGSFPAGRTGKDFAVAALDLPASLESPPASHAHYSVLGGLRLPRPPRSFQAVAESWEAELRKLNDRNMDGKQFSPILHSLLTTVRYAFPTTDRLELRLC